MAVGKLPLAVDLIPDHMSPHSKYPPPTDTTVAFGEHLAGICTGCHGEGLSGGPIAGGDPSWPPAMNRTPHVDGFAGWSYDQFATVLRTGRKPDGTDVRTPMSQMVARYLQPMTRQPFFIPAVIFAVLAVPLIAGVIPPNRFYGVRTRATLSSAEVWYRANRAAGVGVLVASAIYFRVARIRPYSRGAPDDFGTFLVHLAAFAVPLVVALVVVARSARASR